MSRGPKSNLKNVYKLIFGKTSIGWGHYSPLNSLENRDSKERISDWLTLIKLS